MNLALPDELKNFVDRRIEIVQGEDVGMRSRLAAELTDVPGSSIRASGTARAL